jgi:tetratricopeptide (TPR) repeat protein
MSALRWILALTALVAATSTPLVGQAVEESLLLREASAREAGGDLEGAERVLRRLLEATPASSGGIFALERVLRARGEPRVLLPVLDTFLAHDPSAHGVRQLKLRVLAELDSLAALEAEAERWFQVQPASETAFREVARVFERAFGPERALDVLRRGRSAVGSRSALAMEMGDVLAATRQTRPAVEQWALAVGDDGAQAAAVARRVAGLSGDAGGAAGELVAILGASQAPGRRQAAVRIALDLKLGSEALALAPSAVRGLDEGPRVAFLADVARRAREAGIGEVATWAYTELGRGAATPAERRQYDQRLVEMALAAGDTATTLEAQRRVVASYTPGSVDHRRATALQIGLEGAQSTSEELQASLAAFRAEHPDAPELDALAARVAWILAGRGDRDGAARTLEGARGPLGSLESGYLLLEGGETDEARAAFLLAVPGLEPGEATGVIQLVSLLARLSPRARAALAQSGALAHRARGGDAARRLAAAADSVPEGERAPLLAEAARMADAAGQADAAAELRRRILRHHSSVPEAQEAALALARHAAASPDRIHEAVGLLEDLVARWPGAAVAPDARRELERLRRVP